MFNFTSKLRYIENTKSKLRYIKKLFSKQSIELLIKKILNLKKILCFVSYIKVLKTILVFEGTMYVLKNEKENVFRNIFFVYKYIKELLLKFQNYVLVREHNFFQSNVIS